MHNRKRQNDAQAANSQNPSGLTLIVATGQPQGLQSLAARSEQQSVPPAASSRSAHMHNMKACIQGSVGREDCKAYGLIQTKDELSIVVTEAPKDLLQVSLVGAISKPLNSENHE